MNGNAGAIGDFINGFHESEGIMNRTSLRTSIRPQLTHFATAMPNYAIRKTFAAQLNEQKM